MPGRDVTIPDLALLQICGGTCSVSGRGLPTVTPFLPQSPGVGDRTPPGRLFFRSDYKRESPPLFGPHTDSKLPRENWQWF